MYILKQLGIQKLHNVYYGSDKNELFLDGFTFKHTYCVGWSDHIGCWCIFMQDNDDNNIPLDSTKFLKDIILILYSGQYKTMILIQFIKQ